MERRAWWAALLLSWVLLCVPLCLVEVPPLADYPNHLARMYVLANIDRNPVFAANYAVHWGIVPDLAIDLFMPWLLSVLPVHVAGRLLIAGILLLDVLGVTTLAAALHRRRTWWSLGGALVCYNTTFLMGFLNFDLAIGLAMLGAAAWIVVRRRSHPAMAAGLGAATTIVLFFAHLMGVGFYLVLIGSAELPALFSGGPRRIVARCWPVLAAGAPAPLLYAASDFGSVHGETIWLGWRAKLMDCAAGFWTYDWRLDLAVMIAVLGVLAGAKLRLARGGLVAVGAVLILTLALPHAMKTTGFVGTRPAVMAAFLVFIVPAPLLAPAWRVPAALAIALLFGGKMAVVAGAWSAYRTDVANMRALLAPIRPGDVVYQLDVSPDSIPDYAERAPEAWYLAQGHTAGHHLSALTVIERGALWAQLFADPVQQPLSPKAALAAAIALGRRAPQYDALARLRAGAPSYGPNPYCGLDWVVLYGPWIDLDPASLAPVWLTLTVSNRTAALYRVAPASCGAAAALAFPADRRIRPPLPAGAVAFVPAMPNFGLTPAIGVHDAAV